MRGLKALLSTSALLAALAIAPAAKSQVVVAIGVQPVCSYGYYSYAPYACAPAGFYGPGYFYNGIFLGMGPWAGWGYGHGWGEHRFSGDGGGRYHGGAGAVAYRGNANHVSTVRTNSRAASQPHARAASGSYHAAAPRGNASHAAPHAAAPRGGGGGSHESAPHGGSPRGGEQKPR